MNLFTINDVTRLPEPNPELLLIPEFKELIKRVKRIDGDADGRKKTANLMELGYIYYMARYDSRFKLLRGKAREEAVKKLLGLKDDWSPDEVVKVALEKFVDLQTTESTELVRVLGETIQNLTKFTDEAQKQLSMLGIAAAKEANAFLDVVDRIPKTVENLRKAKDMLDREHDALEKGRKGRVPNKFELPDS